MSRDSNVVSSAMISKVRSLYCRKAPIATESPLELYQAETVTEAEALLNFLEAVSKEK